MNLSLRFCFLFLFLCLSVISIQSTLWVKMWLAKNWLIGEGLDGGLYLLDYYENFLHNVYTHGMQKFIIGIQTSERKCYWENFIKRFSDFRIKLYLWNVCLTYVHISAIIRYFLSRIIFFIISGNFICDIVLTATKADIAFINSGTFRSDRIHPKGEFTIRDLLTILPMVDSLVMIKVTGALFCVTQCSVTQI